MPSKMVKTDKPYERYLFRDGKIVGSLTLIALEIFPDEKPKDVQRYIRSLLRKNTLGAGGIRHGIGVVKNLGEMYYRSCEIVFKSDEILIFPYPRETLEEKWDIKLEEIIEVDLDNLDSVSPIIYRDDFQDVN